MDDAPGFIQTVDRFAAAHFQPDLLHRHFELVARFGLFNHGGRGPDHLDLVLLQNAVMKQVHRQIQAGLPAQGGQQGVGTLLGDHLLDHFPSQRFDVGPIGHFGIGHDGGRIGINQYDFIPLFPQRFAGLGTGIVKLAGLPNNDGTGADQQYLFEVVATWHETVFSFLWRKGYKALKK